MFGKEHRTPWGQWADTRGLAPFEVMLTETKGKFCVGDEITLADLFLIPAVYRAGRFELDYKQWPQIAEINDTIALMDFAVKAHCNSQSDAVL